MAIIKSLSLPLSPSLFLYLPPFCMCACVSVVCDLVPEVSMSVGLSGLTLTVQWSGERDTGRGRGEAVTLRLSHRQSSCCVYKFSVCLSIDRQMRQFDWLFCWYSTSSFSFHWRRSNFALRQYLFTLRFQGILPCLFTFVATTSRKPNLHNLLPLRTSIKLKLMGEWSECACFYGYRLLEIESESFLIKDDKIFFTVSNHSIK